MAPIVLDVLVGNVSSRRLHSSGTRHGMALITSGNTAQEKRKQSQANIHRLRFTGHAYPLGKTYLRATHPSTSRIARHNARANPAPR
ncbi:hypothetical protein DPMN_104139 [Dreissena polymorpha]|uniref:Uncharacterized protein n=1 Tax=Dreissena polymorpha TaxID=45954 RepID=A0A9D4K2X0_DREPO|nr:hypothetical protein DPMN_104139 [Dreissena polymorpha]